MDNVMTVFLLLFGIFLVGLWLYCFFDILTSKFRGNEKLLWVVVVLIAPGLGILLYLILGKKSKIKRPKFNPYQKEHF